MGCQSSKVCSRAGKRIFKVQNINDLGAEISAGKIEVTETDLIFFQRGSEPVKWPLKCLRRYGFDEEIFSFECGRNVPTGAGIYAFRCRRAEKLSMLVQKTINNVGASIWGSQTMPDHDLSRPTSLEDLHEPNIVRLPNTARVNAVPSDQQSCINDSLITPVNTPSYVNTGSNNPARATVTLDAAVALFDFLHDPPTTPAPQRPDLVNSAVLDLLRTRENIFEACEGASAKSGNQHVSKRCAKATASCSGWSGAHGSDLLSLNKANLNVLQHMYGDTEPQYMDMDCAGKIKEKDKTKRCEKVIASCSGLSDLHGLNVLISSYASLDDETEPDYVEMDANWSLKEENETRGGSGDGILRLPERKLSIGPSYGNVDAARSTNNPETSVVFTVGMGSNDGNMNDSASSSANCSSNPCELNYIEVDFNMTERYNTHRVTGSSLSLHDLPRKKTEVGYADIDFLRTKALSDCARPQFENDEGTRKTRHNSCF